MSKLKGAACRVAHVREQRALVASGERTLYCGRRGTAGLGNPFVVGETPGVDTREQAIARHRALFLGDSTQGKNLREKVDGVVKPETVLLCHCAPKPCHCDVIAEYVNNGYSVMGIKRRI